MGIPYFGLSAEPALGWCQASVRYCDSRETDDPTVAKRAVAQLGSALRSGRRGRGFKSRQPDNWTGLLRNQQSGFSFPVPTIKPSDRTAVNNPPKKIGAWDVLALRDYKKDTRTDMTSGEVTPTGLPESNVLYYELSNNAWCCVRPSGTEPKIKFYFGVVGTDIKDSEKKLDELRNAMLTYAGE